MQGATMSSALKYWLLMPPAIRTAPPSSPEDSTRTGGHPFERTLVARTPIPARASRRGWIGRLAIASSPSSSYTPVPSAITGVRKRAVVPEFPTKTDARATDSLPAQPSTSKRALASSASTPIPSAERLFAMCSVSSLKRAPSIAERP